MKKQVKKKVRDSSIFKSDSDNTAKSKLFSKVINDDQLILERIKELVRLLKIKHKLSTRDLISLLDDKEILIPVSIFSKKLRILETLVKYLKEELDFSYHNIGVALNRDERNIWNTYQNAKKKLSERLKVESSQYFIPISIFQNKLGALENIVLYLKDEAGLSYHKIGEILERNDRTIWTMYKRATEKNEK